MGSYEQRSIESAGSTMNDEGTARAKTRRKAPLPDFNAIQYKRPVPNTDFITTNAANAKRNIVTKKEPKRVFKTKDTEDNDYETVPYRNRRKSTKRMIEKFKRFLCPCIAETVEPEIKLKQRGTQTSQKFVFINR